MENKFFRSFDGLELPHISFENNNKKKIIILHDLYENNERYIEIGEKLFKDGNDVYLFEYRGHGILRDGKYLDFGKEGIKSVINDLKIFVRKILANSNYEDIILMGIGFGSLLSLYLMEILPLKNAVLNSLNIEKKLNIEFNILFTNIEMKLGLKSSKLNKINDLLNRSFLKEGKLAWLNRDRKVVEEFLNSEKNNIISKPEYYNNYFKLMKYVKKNILDIQNDVNILLTYGSKDPLVSETKLKKYMQKLNSGNRKISFLKITNARHDILNELNKDIIHNEIIKYIKVI